MLRQDWFILLVMGGVFILLGVISIYGGRTEEKRYYNSLATRSDVREYLTHWPQRFGPRAFKIGGWVSIAVGLSMLALSGVFRWWL